MVFVAVKMRYAFHCNLLMMIGVIMATVKFQSQLLLIPTAAP